ncbi:MAG: alpha/beta hydrolase [Gammaproteobacteria bacterium]|nr:alpha/beta hydrolase [Gammaproteobacteria bacterium]
MAQPRMDCVIQLPDKRQLAYAEYGESNGAPVFLFHGLPGSRLSWGYIRDNPFPPGLRIVAPDRPGYGRSDPKPSRTLLHWSDDIAGLADALEIEQFAVVGVSGGGPGALACAWKMPERLTSVGVVACPAPTDALGVFEGMSKTNRFFMKLAWRLPWLSALNVRLLASVIRRNPARYINTMKYKMHDVDKVILARPEIQDMLIKDFCEALRGGAQGMVSDMSANHGRPWGFPLDKIKIKVLFWFCELDLSVPPAMGRYLSNTVPNCDATFVPDAGHLWILEHLNEVLDALVLGKRNSKQKVTL